MIFRSNPDTSLPNVGQHAKVVTRGSEINVVLLNVTQYENACIRSSQITFRFRLVLLAFSLALGKLELNPADLFLS